MVCDEKDQTDRTVGCSNDDGGRRPDGGVDGGGRAGSGDDGGRSVLVVATMDEPH